MTSTNLEPNESGRSIVCENKYIYKWTIHNFKCKSFPYYTALPNISFVFYMHGIKYLGELKLDGNHCTSRIITCTTEQKAFSAKISLENMVILDSTIYALKSHSASLYNEKDKKCLLSEDNITICCELSMTQCEVLNPYQKNIKEKSKLKYSLLVDLFENKHYWDVTFVVAGHEIHAHKCILASRSKVFAAMFEHEMEETKFNRVTINDIDPAVFVEMLRFIYTDKVLNLNKMASDLLAASDKYDLENLKWSCENELANSLTVQNAAEKLILSNLHGSKTLKNYIIKFINCHKNSVLDTKGWKQIVKNHTDLLFELYLKN